VTGGNSSTEPCKAGVSLSDAAPVDGCVPLVSDPIFPARTPKGDLAVGLFDLLALADAGELLDVPAMAAHQRPALVTVLAIFMHLLRRASGSLSDAPAWADTWDREVGLDALRLVAPHDQVAFFQPPTIEPTSQQSIEAADQLLPNVEHEIKRHWQATAPQAVLALIGSLSRPNTKDHRSSTRVGLAAVLPSTDGSLGSEVKTLAQAYDELFPARDRRVADHLVWLQPYRPGDRPLLAGQLPRPFLDVGRAQRIVPAEDGRFEIWAVPNNTIRVEGADLWLDDPHTPKQVIPGSVNRYKLGTKAFDARFAHAILFGAQRKNEEIVRARVLDLTEYRAVRICALGSDQGKTKGYREATFLASRSDGLFSLDEPSPEDRPGLLSQQALSTLEVGEKILYAGLVELFRVGRDLSDTDKVRIKRLSARFRALVGPPSVQMVLDLLHQDVDAAAEQQQLDQLVARSVRVVFDEAVGVLVELLHAARARERLLAGIRKQLMGATMSDTEGRPHLAAQTFAILQDMAAHLTPDDRARLRTMSLVDPPLSFWKLMARVPQRLAEDVACLAVWKTVLRAAGHVRPGNRGLGRALADTDFPEDRMSRLLAASGPSLPGLLDEGARWLMSHDVEVADLSVMATLGLGDALDHLGARDWARRALALEYVRAQSAAERAGSRAAEPAVMEAS
jgi:hypothetical protein